MLKKLPAGVKRVLKGSRHFCTLELQDTLNRIGGSRGDARQGYVSLLRRCGTLSCLTSVHQHMIRSNFLVDRFMKNVLIEMYGKCGSLTGARVVFESIEDGPNVYSWTVLLAAYDQNGYPGLGVQLFNRMELEGMKPSEATLVVVAGLLSKVGDVKRGKQLHARCESQGLLDWDDVLATALLNMLAKLGCIEVALGLFRRLEHKGDIISWTAMIAAHVQSRNSEQAMNLYRKLVVEGIPPASVTFLVIIPSCIDGEVGFLVEVEKQLLERGLAGDSVIGSALVSAYGKQGKVDRARRAFERITRKRLTSWNAMLVIYGRNGMQREALELYRVMMTQRGGTGAQEAADEITYSAVLSACRESLEDGESVFWDATAGGFHLHAQVRSAAIHLHARFGDLEGASSVFEQQENCNSISCWNALIGAFAQHGRGGKVVELLRRMRVEGVDPDEATLVSALFGCSHGGMIEAGLECLMWMRSDHGIDASVEQCRCVVDLVARAGQAENAQQLVDSMDFEPGELETNMLATAFQL